ncbi:DUF115 domain-containing protein [Treponema sp. OttesenSCG-928-L16]|nr:DUF115 domain-containing protein [Treponema sp. OttesenSCG-928-L16]
MTEKVLSSKSGLPTALCGTVSLHSRYNPEKEAETYIASLSLRSDTAFFILLEPGLDYLAQVLQRQFPQSRTISLHCSAYMAGHALPNAGAVWVSGSPVSLEDFLAQHIDDGDAVKVKIIEWKPSQTAYGEAYLEMLRESAAFLKMSGANKRTLRGFGRRWFRNGILNILKAGETLSFTQASCPVLICGAGPSLESAVPLVRDLMDRNIPLFIIAAASAFPALAEAGIDADMIISTDGGPWALFHLMESFRRSGNKKRRPVPCIALSAALPSQYAGLPLLICGDGSAWQRLLINSLGISAIHLPQRGTVTASALDMALALSSGPLYLAGIDFSHQDMITHARPYALDTILESSSDRLRPWYSQKYGRAAAISGSGAHGIYASWFKKKLKDLASRSFFLGKSGALSRDFPVSDLIHPSSGFLPHFYPGAAPSGSVQERLSRAEGMLIKGLRRPDISETLCGELGELLLSDGEESSAAELEKSLGALFNHYRGLLSHG